MGNTLSDNYNSVHTPIKPAKGEWECVNLDLGDASPHFCARAWKANNKLNGEAGIAFDETFYGNITLFKANKESTNKLTTIPSNQVASISSMSVSATSGKKVYIDKSNPYGAFFEVEDCLTDDEDLGLQRAFVYANDIVYYFEPGNPGYVTVGFTGNGAMTW
jgi:hypothetical protein